MSSYLIGCGNSGYSVASMFNDHPEPVVDDLQILAAQLRAAQHLDIPFVYAMLRAEAPLVKIGFTRRLTGSNGRLRRMPNARLVTLAPGDRDEEHDLHERFSEYRVSRFDLDGYGYTEHFQIVQPVVDWINETRTALNLIPVSMDDLLAYSRQAA